MTHIPSHNGRGSNGSHDQYARSSQPKNYANPQPHPVQPPVAQPAPTKTKSRLPVVLGTLAAVLLVLAGGGYALSQTGILHKETSADHNQAAQTTGQNKENNSTDRSQSAPSGESRREDNSQISTDDADAETGPVSHKTRTVTPSAFETSDSIYLITFEGKRGWCLAKYYENQFGLNCGPTALVTDLKKAYTQDPPILYAPISQVNWDPAAQRFGVFSSPVSGTPGGSLKKPRTLKEGESTTIRDFTCYNLNDRFGCDGPHSYFEAVDNEGVFIDGSPHPVGAECGRVGDGNTRPWRIRTYDGNVDCNDAVSVASQLLKEPKNGSKTQHVIRNGKDWACTKLSGDEITEKGYFRICTNNSRPMGSFVIQ
ncbi:hypothetical protein [Corynebacterium anserum]|uniref:Uncharacterized protein n=1 Tax=Corynebacterium anserum TaxID=2684406 RepID=A0A7G7YPE4_9CORY|nr:hypothetical protein [Corynebacterium anserum]MBC2681982.1 hypothetical protein [Corynebacterium anserum]QNH96364.1 hypothetical protein GP473_06540 [Corynebacterium anserum]